MIKLEPEMRRTADETIVAALETHYVAESKDSLLISAEKIHFNPFSPAPTHPEFTLAEITAK